MYTPRIGLSNRPFVTVVAALSLSACAAASPQFVPDFGSNGAPSAAKILTTKPSGKLTISPPKLNFTTTPALKLQIKEAGYTGNFTLSASPSKLVTFSKKTAKGPAAIITVTAVTAGTGSIAVKDQSGNKATVQLMVTQSVIIIQ